MPVVISDEAATVGIAAKTALVDVDGPGVFQVRTGSKPEEADASPSGTLLVEYTLADPAFGADAPGVQVMQDLPMTEPGAATGTAGHVRIADGNGAGVFVGSVRSSNEPDNNEFAVMNTREIVEGVDAALLSCQVQDPTGANGS